MAEPSYDGNQSKDENDLKLASENESCKVSHNKIEDLETNSGNPCLSNQSLDRKQPSNRPYFSIKKCNVNLIKIPIPSSNETVFCPNCNEKVVNIPLHFENSLICSQVQFQANNHQPNIVCNTPNKKKITKGIKKGVTKCL